MKTYSYEEVLNASIDYFNGDDLAAKVFVDKYCLQDEKGRYYELTPADMHSRLASEFARIEKTKFKKPYTFEQIYELFDHFKYIVPQGSPMFGIGNKFQTVSLSNCFVLETPKDSYGSILKIDEQLVQMSKRRGGVGFDISNIRPKDSPIKNAAKTSTGVVSFMERYSNSIREVGQYGRRGALMLTIDVRHPDIEDFIVIKNDLTKVTGANISIRINNEFIKAVEEDDWFTLKFPVDSDNPKVKKRIKAKELWNKITENAWKMAEPGVLLWDNVLEESIPDCYESEGFKTVSTNPCVVPETLVLTNLGWIEIQNLKKYQEEYSDLKVITRDAEGILFASELKDAFITKRDAKLKIVHFDNGEHLLTTPEHEFYLEDFKLKQVQNLEMGDLIIGGEGLLEITNVEDSERISDVWDLTAVPNYNFFSLLGYKENINSNYIEINEDVKFRYYDIVKINGSYDFAFKIAENDEVEF